MIKHKGIEGLKEGHKGKNPDKTLFHHDQNMGLTRWRGFVIRAIAC